MQQYDGAPQHPRDLSPGMPSFSQYFVLQNMHSNCSTIAPNVHRLQQQDHLVESGAQAQAVNNKTGTLQQLLDAERATAADMRRQYW